MRRLLTEQKSFLIPYLIFLLAGLVITGTTDKEVLHLFTNRFHTSFFNHFFAYITYLGDGIAAAVIGVGLLIYRVKPGLFLLTATLSSGLFTQFLKKVVFPNTGRPLQVIGEENLYLIEHIQNHLHFSFPSGHTTTAFALFFSLAWMSKNRLIKTLCFFLALIIGYSRVYLSQHFAVDVVFGSLIGVVFVILSSFIYCSKKHWLMVSPYKMLCKHE